MILIKNKSKYNTQSNLSREESESAKWHGILVGYYLKILTLKFINFLPVKAIQKLLNFNKFLKESYQIHIP